jgi:hypothetical protein
MSFLKKLFGGGSDTNKPTPSTFEHGGLDETVVEAISVVMGHPHIPAEEPDAKAFYRKSNPTWSGRHRITVLRTASQVPADKDGVAKCVKVFVERNTCKGRTLLVQVMQGAPCAVCLCTLVRGIDRTKAGDADCEIAIVPGPIPFIH